MMIKPFVLEEHRDATVVNVQGFGIVHLDQLPQRVWHDEKGYWQLGWTSGSEGTVLSVYGGKGTLDFNGENVGVVAILERKVISAEEKDKYLDFFNANKNW